MNDKNTSSGDKLRKRLFDLYSKNLMVVKKDPRIRMDPDNDDLYICPICMKLFPREALSLPDDSDQSLTLEDVPPKALGGNKRLLTCRKCNNTGGSQLEKHLVNKLKFEEGMQGLSNTSIDGKVLFPKETKLSATLSFLGNSGIYIETHSDRSNPKDVYQFMDMADTREDLGKFTLTVYGNYRQGRPEVALIRIAYLLAYSTFGFGFLMNLNLQLIREQIRTPHKKLMENWGILYSDFPDAILGVNIMTEPKELRSYLVVFDIKTTNRISRYGVLLPGPTNPGNEIYKWLTLPENNNFTFYAYKIPNNDYLKKPELAFAPDSYWRSATTI